MHSPSDILVKKSYLHSIVVILIQMTREQCIHSLLI